MISVGLFTYSTRPRGSVVHAVCLGEALTQAGHDVTLYALGKAGAIFYRQAACHVVIFPACEAPSDPDALVRQRIAELVSGFDSLPMHHDVFHAQDCLAASALLEARARRPVVRTVHHVDRFVSPYLAACQRRSILQADAVFSVSRLTQRDVLAEYGRRSSIAPNGVDVARFASVPPATMARARARLGIEAGDTVVLSVGGVEPRKNTRRALAAVARACARHPSLKWVLVGGESLWDHAEYRAAFDADFAALPPDIARRIVRAGPVEEDELTALYRASDVLLCPSEHEGFGLCVLEAMAAGTAVVVPGRAPFTEYVDAETGVLVDPESVESIAVALVGLLDDAPRRQELAARARARTQAFSWSHSAAEHVRLYAALRASPLPGAPDERRESIDA
jgi:glycosyltransferase-like protein